MLYIVVYVIWELSLDTVQVRNFRIDLSILVSVLVSIFYLVRKMRLCVKKKLVVLLHNLMRLFISMCSLVCSGDVDVIFILEIF